MKEQNKPETANENTKHIIAAAELHYCYAENFDTKENSYLDGVKYGAHVALTYASENMFSREDCEKMLEALRQRCVAQLAHGNRFQTKQDCFDHNQDAILSVEYKDLIK